MRYNSVQFSTIDVFIQCLFSVENIMATIKLVIIPSRPQKKGGFMVYSQITSHYQSIRKATNITVEKDHWDQKHGEVIGGKKGDAKACFKNTRLDQVKASADLKILQFPDKVEAMNIKQLKAYLLDDEEIKIFTDFFGYCQKKKDYYNRQNMKKSEDLINCVHEKLREYQGSDVLPFNDITSEFLEEFEYWCLTTPKKTTAKIKDPQKIKFMTQGGVNVYMRYIRIIFNDAISDDLVVKYPFRKFKIKLVKTKNRNLPIETLRMIRDYTPANQREEITRDLLMLQVYLSGINMADLWNLTLEDVNDGRLQFYRKKTIRYLRYHNIKIEPEAQAILNKYRGEKYLLWFAESRVQGEVINTAELKYSSEPTFLKMINRTIVSIQKTLNIHDNAKITDYWMRHSVATILRTDVKLEGGASVGVSDVANILGHKEVEHKVTGTYIKEDYAGNDKIMRALIDKINL